jgi:hypothetical protein
MGASTPSLPLLRNWAGRTCKVMWPSSQCHYYFPKNQAVRNMATLPCAIPITVAARSKAWTIFIVRTLGSWVRISLGTWMFVYVYSVLVLLCVAALRRADPHPRSPTDCVKKLTKPKKRRGPNKGLQSHWWMNETPRHICKLASNN